MKVSVLMPVYRTDAGFLREAIASVLSQTFADFEFLILDDCPEDDRSRVVAEFSDRRIVYVRNDRNMGISASRNRLMDLAKGEYLAVLDHDDTCRPERFAKQVAWLDEHPECGVVASWTRMVPDDEIKKFPSEDRDIKLAMMCGCSIWHPASMIRRSAIEAAGVRYEAAYSPCEDYMLWMKLAPHVEFHNIPEALTEYRWHASNTSLVCKPELDAADARCKAWAKANLPELYGEYELRRETVSRVKLFGVPLLKVRSSLRRTDAKLFNCIPIFSVTRKYDA